jgi:hypothetical protein
LTALLMLLLALLLGSATLLALLQFLFGISRERDSSTSATAASLFLLLHLLSALLLAHLLWQAGRHLGLAALLALLKLLARVFISETGRDCGKEESGNEQSFEYRHG